MQGNLKNPRGGEKYKTLSHQMTNYSAKCTLLSEVSELSPTTFQVMETSLEIKQEILPSIWFFRS